MHEKHFTTKHEGDTKEKIYLYKKPFFMIFVLVVGKVLAYVNLHCDQSIHFGVGGPPGRRHDYERRGNSGHIGR